MPTILIIRGWRFFYANENNEPIHIHCKPGSKETKYWLLPEEFDVVEAYAYQMTAADKRTVKRIIFEYFEFIEEKWQDFQKRKLK